VGERPEGLSALVQRQQLLNALEGREFTPAPARHIAPEPVVAEVLEDEPVAQAIVEQRKPVIPERPEPFTPPRQPEHAEEPLPALSRIAASAARSAMAPSASASPPSSPAASVGSVQGAHALQPDHQAETAPATHSYIDRDPSVNKSLLLRLIAGVRGL
jgi:hypothetical protein